MIRPPKALLYVESVADLDKSNPQAARYEEGQTCANCIQIQGEEADFMPCGIFPGKVCRRRRVVQRLGAQALNPEAVAGRQLSAFC